MSTTNSLFRRSLVFGIIILFIGAGIVPSMSGYTEKTSIQSTKEASTNFPLNNNYVDAYWKFDDCSGDTLSDSSGHGYDGTIYGATWVGGGYSGCALDFDGVDDYVDLDTHSENIGFNKTDDLIFSVYFKTTSTDSGCIYSLSHHWVGNYPEAHIELTSDGNIKIQVWVGTCGLALISEDIYNDGSLHHAEIWYNGITANPTVTLYVDDELETSITDWVCAFYNDEFERAKIGRKARDAIEYFDGVIDEFKIIKYAGGNQQASPIIEGPTGGEVGVEYDFTFTTNDPEEDEIWLYIDWGDGTNTDWFGPHESGEEVILSHTWYENGSYTITAKSMDIWDDGPPSHHTIRIGDVPPVVVEITGPKYEEVGEELTYTFVGEDYNGDDIWIYVDWGDGTHEDWIGPVPSGEEIQASHAWMEKGIYQIRAKAKDDVGEGEWSNPFEVIIGNEPPSRPEISGPPKGVPGVEYDYQFVATDPEGGNVWYRIDWDDETGETEYGPYVSGLEITLSHSWEVEDIYVIKARARDVHEFIGAKETLQVTIPRNRVLNFNLLNLLVQRFQNTFPVLRYLLGL